MTNRTRVFSLLLCAIANAAAAQTQRTMNRGRVQTVVDSIVAGALRGGQVAGMSVAILRGADTLLLKSYGYADLELQVPTPPRAIYEIGSVTKQFTAAAIMQLRDAGKLSLEDPITKYVPSLDTHGREVTLNHLLHHTSGIPNYSEVPGFQGRVNVQALPRDTVIRLINAAPPDFAPGDAMRYDNTGYFLLGLVIERVSGLSYADYVTRNLFARAGMNDSFYCSQSRVVKRRAHGYDMADSGLQHATFIDMRWPFAAGALCSTAGDLAAWTRALHTGRILGPVGYRDMIAVGTLNDGARLRYASGLAQQNLAGHRAIAHEGDIPGFTSKAAWFPDDSLTFVILVNTEGPVRPDNLMRDVMRIAFGAVDEKPSQFHGRASDYIGEYRASGREPLTLKVATDSLGALTMKVNADAPAPMTWRGNDQFMLGNVQFTFGRQGQRVTTVRADFMYTNTLAMRQP